MFPLLTQQPDVTLPMVRQIFERPPRGRSMADRRACPRTRVERLINIYLLGRPENACLLAYVKDASANGLAVFCREPLGVGELFTARAPLGGKPGRLVLGQCLA